jgi:hypothetical protein
MQCAERLLFYLFLLSVALIHRRDSIVLRSDSSNRARPLEAALSIYTTIHARTDPAPPLRGTRTQKVKNRTLTGGNLYADEFGSLLGESKA